MVTDNDLNAFDEYTTSVPATTKVARFSSQSDKRRSRHRPVGLRAEWSAGGGVTPYLGYVEYVDGTGTMVEAN